MPAKLIVALDIPSSDRIGPLVDALPQEIPLYKVGLELFGADGIGALRPLVERKKGIFLDLKLHDIPRTVARAVEAISRHGVQLITLHATGGRAMMEAAAAAARDAGPDRPRLLAVTALTSLDAKDLREIGMFRSPQGQVLAMARLAIDCGIDGVVASVQEAAALRSALGSEALIVTPGIRLRPEASSAALRAMEDQSPGQVHPASAEVGDQKRIGTPADAVRAGASHIVVGRPILEAPDPRAAAVAILNELADVGGAN